MLFWSFFITNKKLKKNLTKTEKNVTFFNAFNHFLIDAKLRILPDDLNA
jgi:hypothetical protein